jgi:hypothetical protein
MLLLKARFLSKTVDNFCPFVERVSLSSISFPLVEVLKPLSSNSLVTSRLTELVLPYIMLVSTYSLLA